MSTGVQKVFDDYLHYLEDETKIKEELGAKVQELEQTSRDMVSTLHEIHTQAGFTRVQEICQQIVGRFDKVRTQYGEITKTFPSDQYYRYNMFWKHVTQQLVFLAALTHYLQSDTLISRKKTCETLGVKETPKEGFHLDLEDFLAGLIMMSNELPRFAMNSVTHGDYERPQRISAFLQDLSVGFRLLNLKNDFLRKKFDSLKYDMKRVEEVVYDLSIRGLLKKKDGASADAAGIEVKSEVVKTE